MAHAAESDVNGDGRSDLVAVHSNGTAYTYLGRSDAYFWSPIPSFAGTMGPALWSGLGHYVIDVADVHGDGRADLVTLTHSGNVLVYGGRADGSFNGNGTASFSGTMTPGLNTPSAGGFMPIAVADVTGDGRGDLVTLQHSGTVYLYPGQSNGYFGPSRGSFSGTMDPALFDRGGYYPVDVVDVTRDGRADLIVQHTHGYLYVYLGQSSGYFPAPRASFSGSMQPAMEIGSAGYEPVGSGDVDGDGHTDLVMHHNNSAYVYRGNSSGYFGTPVSARTGIPSGLFGNPNGHEAITVMDVQGDGRADLLTQQGGSVLTFPGLSTSRFAEPSISFSGTFYTPRYSGVGYEPVQEKPARRRRNCGAAGCTGYPTSDLYGGTDVSVNTEAELNAVATAMSQSEVALSNLWNGLSPGDRPAVHAYLDSGPVVEERPTEEYIPPPDAEGEAAVAAGGRCKRIKNSRLKRGPVAGPGGALTLVWRVTLTTRWCYSGGFVRKIYPADTDCSVYGIHNIQYRCDSPNKIRANCYGDYPERCAWTYNWPIHSRFIDDYIVDIWCATNQVRGDGRHYRHGSCDLGPWSGTSYGGSP